MTLKKYNILGDQSSNSQRYIKFYFTLALWDYNKCIDHEIPTEKWIHVTPSSINHNELKNLSPRGPFYL